MLNHIVIMGRLTRDPEYRTTGSNLSVCNFSVAVDRDFSSQSGEKETDFIDCVAWRKTAEFVTKYFVKGSMVVVSGSLQIRSWTDKDGNKRRTAEIVASSVYFGESKKSQEGNAPTYGQNTYPGGTAKPAGYQNQQPQGYGYQPQFNQQGYNPNSYERQVNSPQYNQQGFGGYQQQGFQGQVYQPPQGAYAPIEDDDPKLPF